MAIIQGLIINRVFNKSGKKGNHDYAPHYSCLTFNNVNMPILADIDGWTGSDTYFMILIKEDRTF